MYSLRAVGGCELTAHFAGRLAEAFRLQKKNFVVTSSTLFTRSEITPGDAFPQGTSTAFVRLC